MDFFALSCHGVFSPKAISFAPLQFSWAFRPLRFRATCRAASPSFSQSPKNLFYFNLTPNSLITSFLLKFKHTNKFSCFFYVLAFQSVMLSWKHWYWRPYFAINTSIKGALLNRQSLQRQDHTSQNKVLCNTGTGILVHWLECNSFVSWSDNRYFKLFWKIFIFFIISPLPRSSILHTQLYIYIKNKLDSPCCVKNSLLILHLRKVEEIPLLFFSTTKIHRETTQLIMTRTAKASSPLPVSQNKFATQDPLLEKHLTSGNLH